MSSTIPNYVTMNYAARRADIEISNKAKKSQLDRIYRRDHGICQLCMKPCIREEASRDHIIGPTESESYYQFNSDTNVLLAHQLCNNQKSWKPSAKLRTVKDSQKRHLTYTIEEAFPDFPWK